ncbi:MAG: hypothetical protein GX550_02785 [Syntrophomonadaceae bacterium]|nr:hypothetical protein [Syntrophomonadaceae bacterium]
MQRSKVIKTIILALCFTLALTCATGGKMLSKPPVPQPVARPDITIVVNGQETEYPVPPVIEQDRILVPVRDLAEQLGAKVEWLETQNRVVINNVKDRVEITIGEKSAYINGQKADMDVPARIIENRTFVPLRFISETLAAEVTWLPEERTVLIEFESPVKPVGGNIRLNNFIYSSGQLVVTGVARVWEANVLYEVTDQDGEVLFNGFTTASIGAPEWGDFTFSVDGDLSEAHVLRVFSESAKDGSKMDVVEYFLKPFGTAKVLAQEPGSILVEGILDGYSQQPVQFYFALSPETIITDDNNNQLEETDLKPGDQLQIWISYPGLVLESWPARAKAGKIIKLSENLES